MEDIKVAIVAIARLENDYINEWIGHHLGIGVNHIYVYDNSSSEEEKLHYRVYDKYFNNVTIIPAYDKVQYQMPAYKEAYEKYGKMYDYIIYIDIDEFIMLQKDKTINDFVKRLPNDCECYRMNWLIYGDNDIVNRDVSSSVVKDFSKPLIDNKHNTTTKSIIKGGLDNIDFISVHYAIRNINGVKSNLNTYFGDMINITNDLPIEEKSLNIHRKDYTYIKLNHYITKSICEFISQKMRRPDAAWNYERNIDKDFFQYNKKTQEKIDVYNQSQNIIKYYYYSPKKFENGGDYYNKILVNKLYYCICKPMMSDIDVAFCGSILGHASIKDAKYIVGCGFQDSLEPVNKNENAYVSVRGKMTKQRLINNGIRLKDNIKFIDPGLLVSKIYDFGDVQKKYKIGIIPHYVDEDNVRKIYGDKYNIISMKTSDIQGICRKIKECEIILSSSLHGIIFSHSLGVPAYHIEMKKLREGDNFKFKDYYTCYNSELHYENFKCINSIIPFERILEYDRNNRTKCNPSGKDILIKQQEFLSILPYKKYLNKKFIVYQDINVCFTSHKARINKIKRFIDTLLNQTIPVNVYLTLSSDEFPGKENELPEYIRNINDPRFHINWVKRNIKPFKKSLYTLKHLNDESIIITLDDDVLLNNDTIEIAVKYFDGNYPLSVCNKIRSVGYDGKMYRPTGCFTIYNKSMVKNWETIINDDIINTNDDDSFMIALFWLNGYYNKPIPIDIKFDKTMVEKESSLTEFMKLHDVRNLAKATDSLISKSVMKITGKDLYNSFGCFNNNTPKNTHITPTSSAMVNLKNISNKSKPVNRITQLRDDIQAGRMIKIPTGHGFIWRRVK